ncbi:MAG TPA: IPT/TIG domain-containing protein [Vicinamibacterales bacterium]|nr:IPT/TIG domain-containing protein [Vicinamibacterales bacterium]
MPAVTSVIPERAVGRGRVTINGSGFDIGDASEVMLRDIPARISFASSKRIVITIPDEIEGGHVPVRLGDTTVGELSIGSIWATGLHQVDNPVFDRDGNLFVTYSGSRGQEAPVSIFRVTSTGTREPFVSGVVNATSMAIGPDGKLYVSSRFEGAVYRVALDGTPEQVASDLGVACGIAFDEDGSMFVGDRSGTIFRVRDGRATAFATLPASVAAFHLAMSPDGELHVTAPTLGTYDPIYKIDKHGLVTAIASSLGRPQGLAFGSDRKLYVVDALAGSSGLHRLETDGTFTPIVAGGALVGVAFGPNGELIVASNETVYRFD